MMKIKTAFAMTLLLLLATASPALAQSAKGIEWKHEKGKDLSLIKDGKVAWHYHFDPADNHPYFDAVSVPGGPNMAAFAPGDHLWHKGLWFSWKYINDVNFWDWTEARGNNPKWPARPPHRPDGWTKMLGEEAFKIGKEGATLEMTIGYGRGEKLWMKESRWLALGEPDGDGNYLIDWRSTFTAQDQKLVFDRSPVQPTTGGYAGLGLRAPETLKNVIFTNSLGTLGKACRGQQADWVDMTTLTDERFGPTGLTIYDHPANPRHPTAWHVQDNPQGKTPFFYFNAALLYNEPLTLEAGKSMTLRYRIMVHKGELDAATMNGMFKMFAETRLAK